MLRIQVVHNRDYEGIDPNKPYHFAPDAVTHPFTTMSLVESGIGSVC